jgi:hypothetical protein
MKTTGRDTGRFFLFQKKQNLRKFNLGLTSKK